MSYSFSPKKFLALPKRYSWPEDLEDGLFDDDIELHISVKEKAVDVNYNKITPNGKIQVDGFHFPFCDYWIFIDGKLYEPEEKSNDSNE